MKEKFEFKEEIRGVEEILSRHNFIVERELPRGILFRNLDDRSEFVIKTSCKQQLSSLADPSVPRRVPLKSRFIEFAYQDRCFVCFFIDGDEEYYSTNPGIVVTSMADVCEKAEQQLTNGDNSLERLVDKLSKFVDETTIDLHKKKLEFLKKENKECDTVEEVFEQNGQKMKVQYDLCCADALHLFHGINLEEEIKKVVNEEK